MIRKWISVFFDTTMRDFDSKISAILAKRPIGTSQLSYSFEGTEIKDYLSTDDWKSLDQELTEQLELKNDRSVAISYHAALEDRLRWLIECQFIEGLSKGKKAWLFEGAGPLSSHVARVEIGFAMGLFHADLRSEILELATIRNKFAHQFRRVRFTDPKIADLCNGLKKYPGASDDPDPMKRYAITCFLVMIALFAIGHARLRVGARPTSPGKPDTRQSQGPRNSNPR